MNTMAARQAERSVDEREWMCRRIRKRVERQRAQYVCARRTPARGDEAVKNETDNEAVKNETDNEDGNNDNLQFSNSMQRNATQFNSTTQCNAIQLNNAMQWTRKNARWKERSRDGSNGPAMFEMRRPATRRED